MNFLLKIILILNLAIYSNYVFFHAAYAANEETTITERAPKFIFDALEQLDRKSYSKKVTEALLKLGLVAPLNSVRQWKQGVLFLDRFLLPRALTELEKDYRLRAFQTHPDKFMLFRGLSPSKKNIISSTAISIGKALAEEFGYDDNEKILAIINQKLTEIISDTDELKNSQELNEAYNFLAGIYQEPDAIDRIQNILVYESSFVLGTFSSLFRKIFFPLLAEIFVEKATEAFFFRLSDWAFLKYLTIRKPYQAAKIKTNQLITNVNQIGKSIQTLESVIKQMPESDAKKACLEKVAKLKIKQTKTMKNIAPAYLEFLFNEFPQADYSSENQKAAQAA